MKANDYMHEAKNVSAVLGRDSDVKVLFEGDSAYTDGENIVLPSIDSQKDMSEFNVKVARGYVDHEAAHVKWTDQEQWKDAVMTFKENGQHVSLKSGCMNALEDVRIEKKLIDMYAGSKDNLEAVAQSVLGELDISVKASGKTIEGLNAVEIGGLAATWYGRMKHGYGGAGGKYFKRLDTELQEVVKEAVDRLDSAEGTKQVAMITEDFVSDLLRLAGEGDDDQDGEGGDEKQDGEGSEGEQDGDDDGESGEGDNETAEDGESGSGEQDGDDGGSGDADDGVGCKDSLADDSQGDGDDKTKVSGGRSNVINRDHDKIGSEPYDPDRLKQKAVQRALNPDANAKRQRGSKFRRFTDRYDIDATDTLMDDVKNYDTLLQATVGQTNVLRRTLERKLAAKMMRTWHGGQTKGRLDSRRLVGAYTGSEHVYKTREEADDLDTALMILVDHSGSMIDRIDTAAKATVALAVALENTPIAYAIQGFTTIYLPDDVWAAQHHNSKKYESFTPVVTLRYKEFTDRLVKVRGKMGGMPYNYCNPNCLNVDGVSLQKSGNELLKRPEKRKVLMVLSDGEPHDGYSRVKGGLEKHLKSVVETLASKGVEVFGIGIESDAVSSYYPDYAVLNSLADLEKEVIGKMEGLLIDGGRRVRKAS